MTIHVQLVLNQVSSFCEILFVFLQQIFDFHLIQNNTHLVDYYPSSIPSNFLSDGFVVSDKNFFSHVVLY